MRLYIVYTPNLDDRKVDTIFFYRDNGCFIKTNFCLEPLLDVKTNQNNFYKDIINYAQENQLDSYEIVLCDDNVPEVLK